MRINVQGSDIIRKNGKGKGRMRKIGQGSGYRK